MVMIIQQKAHVAEKERLTTEVNPVIKVTPMTYRWIFLCGALHLILISYRYILSSHADSRFGTAVVSSKVYGGECRKSEFLCQ